MSPRNKCVPILLTLVVMLGSGSLSSGQKRSVTVSDAIRMTRVGGPLEASLYTGVGPKTGFAEFSPDGKRFVIVVRTGNLETNANDYSLLLVRTADILRFAKPRRLIAFSSSSNEDGISAMHWLPDNDTILFLGSRGTGPTELYSIRAGSGELKRLTNHKTSLTSYSLSADGEQIVYAAKSPEREVITRSVLKRGFEVSAELLPDLAMGKIKVYEPELYVKKKRAGADRRLATRGPTHPGMSDLFLSPDGRYLLLKTDVPRLPETWREYKDDNIRAAFRRRQLANSSSLLLQYELVDVRSGKSDVLLDAPAPFSSDDVLWSPDSHSLLLCGTYLPLDVDDAAELYARKENKFVVEVNIPGRRIVKISNEELRPARWDPKRNIVQFYSRRDLGQSNGRPQAVYYRKRNAMWERLPDTPPGMTDVRPDIRIEQDLNLPPKVVAWDALTNRQIRLMDFNPQFAKFRFGRVNEIQWIDSSGASTTGGLYFPPDYDASRRYPLVIQTHGFDPHAFWIDGPWPTTFAAQPLASQGIVVLQVNDRFADSLDTPDEMERAMRSYEGAIDYLDQKGIIDATRVGLVGFSRTCLYVKYTLTHSRKRFAAAIASDGFDGGYFEYLVLSNAIPLAASEIETLIGASPFGPGLSGWLKRSPGFLLDRVHTPVQLQANGPASLFGEWEWFSGLQRSEKPVDLLYLPTGTHILTKPWDRLASQARTVDWLCFWLKGQEDRDPTKTAQYARWRGLRIRRDNSESN